MDTPLTAVRSFDELFTDPRPADLHAKPRDPSLVQLVMNAGRHMIVEARPTQLLLDALPPRYESAHLQRQLKLYLWDDDITVLYSDRMGNPVRVARLDLATVPIAELDAIEIPLPYNPDEIIDFPLTIAQARTLVRLASEHEQAHDESDDEVDELIGPLRELLIAKRAY